MNERLKNFFSHIIRGQPRTCFLPQGPVSCPASFPYGGALGNQCSRQSYFPACYMNSLHPPKQNSALNTIAIYIGFFERSPLKCVLWGLERQHRG